MEELLPYCLESFLIKRNIDKLEVVIVNDGSKDSSLSIAESYRERFPDTFRIIDKKNGNYGSCINVALPFASGNYIKVVDADDSVDTANLDEFISFLEKNNVDLALSDFAIVNENREITKSVSYRFGGEIFDIDSIAGSDSFMKMEMHAVTYRRSILIDSGYRQTEGISYTDQQWIFIPMADVKTVAIFNKIVYHYLVGREGQTMNQDIMIRKIGDRIKFTSDMVLIYDQIINRAIPLNLKKYLSRRLYLNIFDIYSSYFTNSNRINKSDICNFDSFVKDNSESIYNIVSSESRQIKIWRRIHNASILEKIFTIIYSKAVSLKSLCQK